MELSQLHFHSWGLVTTNKAMDSDIVKVTPIEFRFGQPESVVSVPEEEEETYNTDEGEEILKIKHDNSVTAKWIKFNSNRITSPDVRRNDQVMIWRLGNTDKYYWSDMNIANVKRLETSVHAWSADPNNPIADDLSNAYFLEVSTHNKTITLQTSQANEEPFGYTIQLNTGDGVFLLKDTADNTLYLNSADTVIGFLNAMGTELRLDKKNIVAYAPDSMMFTAEKTMDFKCTDFILNASKTIAMTTSAYTCKADTFTVTAPEVKYDSTNITFNATLVTSNAPTTVCTGLLKCAGLSVGGAGASGGGLCVVNNFAEFKNGLKVVGGLVADTAAFKTLTADTATFKSHGPH